MSFENAPVTKGLMLTSALSSIAVGILDVKHYFHLQLVPHISRHHQYWRLAVSHLTFSSSADLFIALLLLFNVAVPIERRFGSTKFASFIIACALVATTMQFTSLLLFHRFGFNYIPPGPFALTFSILYQYSRLVPLAYRFRIFGVPLSDQTFNYLLALLFAITHHSSSMVVAVIGILTGQIYRSDLANLKTYRVSQRTVGLCTRYILPLIGSTRAPRRRNRAFPDASRDTTDQPVLPQVEQPISTSGPPDVTNNERAVGEGSTVNGSVMREWVDELTGRADRANAGIRAPSEAEVTMLRSMFPDITPEVIVGALQRSTSTENAVETLLSSRP